ncbi:UNVERIFIED_CONTAM: hypothetical protein ABID98_004052 [Brevibacillus sp. OAP136]
MSKHMVFDEIEALRKKMNDQYKKHSAITPELLDLSVKLDQLLNQLPPSVRKTC